MKIFLTLLLFLIQVSLYAQVKVKGYYRKDGTYVNPHYRSNPDGNPYNNWSYPGNTNPYTGKKSTGNTGTYLRSYYNEGSKSARSNVSLSTTIHNNTEAYNHSNNIGINHYVISKSLNLRTGPSTSHTVVKALKYSDQVIVKKFLENGWALVEVSSYTYKGNSYEVSSASGYVYYLSFTNPGYK